MKIDRLSLLLAVIFCCCCSPVVAQQSKFQALFVTKITEGVNWSDGTSSTVIGVMESTQVQNYLEAFTKNKSNVQVVEVTSTLQNLESCKVLFVASGSDEYMPRLIEKVGNRDILIISENEKWTGKGSDVGFFLRDGKLKFLVSESSLARKGLKMSSRLISLGETL